MICPKCHGTGVLVVYRGYWATGEMQVAQRSPCDHPGCHNGQIDCCDGIRENDG